MAGDNAERAATLRDLQVAARDKLFGDGAIVCFSAPLTALAA